MKIREIDIYKHDSGTPEPQPTSSLPQSVSTATPSVTATPTPNPTPYPSPVFIGTERVSLNSSGQQSDRDVQPPSISDDGRYVVFSAIAKGFFGSSTSAFYTVFLKDRVDGSIVPVSVSSSGNPAPGRQPSISGDGRYISYTSNATNIVVPDLNKVASDIFVFDSLTGQTEIATVDSSGNQSSSFCSDSQISGTGRYVVFLCSDGALAPGDNNNFMDVFLHDRQTGITELVSVDNTGIPGNSDSLKPSVSDDGRFVVFDSRSDSLVAGDVNATSDVFIHDRQTGLTSLVSINDRGLQGNDESDTAHISGDGQSIVFQSFATNLVAGANNRNIFLHDRVSNSNYLVSKNFSGQSSFENYFPSVSDDGRYVAFESADDNLLNGDGNGFYDVYVHDVITGKTLLVSKSTSGSKGNNHSSDDMGVFKTISGNGKYVAYQSQAGNIVSGDTNSTRDILVSKIR